MEKDNFLDPLERIASVDPPPFLFTRIDARISALSADVPARPWIFASATAMLFVLALNAFMFVGQGSSTGQVEGSVATIAEEMGMYTSNQLYNE